MSFCRSILLMLEYSCRFQLYMRAFTFTCHSCLHTLGSKHLVALGAQQLLHLFVLAHYSFYRVNLCTFANFAVITVAV